LPGEEKLFAEFPDAIQPYAAIRDPRHRKLRLKVVSYQMVQEPCPLHDPDARTCTRYDERPGVCRAYPFSANGTQIEANCGWHNSVRQQLHYGETAVIHGKEQASAEHHTNLFFMTLHKRMQRTGRTQLLLYDIALPEWVQLKAVEDA
jgi:Fe-S-cluster containining protein